MELRNVNYNKVIDKLLAHEKNCGADDIYYSCNCHLGNAIKDLTLALEELLIQSWEIGDKSEMEFYKSILKEVEEI